MQTYFIPVVAGEHLDDFAEMVGIECLRIGQETRLRDVKNELRWNQAFYRPGRG